MYLSWREMIAIIPQLEEADKAYTQAFAEKSIRTSQTNLLFQLGLRDKDLMQYGWQKYGQLTADFKDELTGLIADFEKGKISTEDCMKVWKEKTGDYYQNIFQAGAAASGNPFYEKLGLTKKDQAFMSSARRAESKYWSNFLTDIKDPDHNQRFDYQERAGFYGESGKAQFWNGCVAGAGDEVEIHWVLGVPMTEHCEVCPEMAMGVYTWETLPFVPRDGSTPCLWRCYCNLEILPRIKIGTLSDMPGSATADSLSATGRFAELYDEEGVAVVGEAQQTVEDYYGQMYKARQMMEITEGDELANWVARRIGINQELIDFLEARKYRGVPTVSVSDLVSTVRAAAEMPETALLAGEAAEVGQEVLFIRANFSSFGKLTMGRNQLSFINGKNIRLPVNEETDVLFEMTDTRVTASPAENKKFFMKIFGKNKETYDAFVKVYEQAVEEGSRIPSEVAWIKFRELYDNVLGLWVRK